MFKKIFTALLVGGLFVGTASFVYAQEDGENQFTYGIVLSAKATGIVIQEYDFINDADVETEYLIDAQTAFEDMESVADIQAGDEVNIEYVEADGSKLIKSIFKSDPEEDQGFEEDYTDSSENE